MKQMCLFIILGCLFFSGQSNALYLEVVSPMKRVFLDTSVKNQKDLKIEIWAARNEYESAQIAMQSDATTTIQKVEATDLVNMKNNHIIEKKYFNYRFPEFVNLKKNTKDTPASELDAIAPNWFPDPLEEAKSRTFKGVCSLWLTWYVPSDKGSAGDYSGELIITTDTESHRIPVVLHVWNFAIPEKPTMYVTNWLHTMQIESQYLVRKGSEEYWNIVEKIAQDMIDHRQNVIFTPLNLIKSTKLPNGSYTFDFKDYEKWVAIFMRRGFVAIEGSHLFHPGNSYDIRYQVKGSSNKVSFDRKQLETTEGKAYLSNLLSALHKENVKLGIADKYLQHVGDEPKPEQLGLYKEIAGIVHKSMPGVPTFDATDMPLEMIKGMTDIPVPLLKQNMDKTQTAGNKWGKWWYTAMGPRGKFPNRFIDYPLLKMRIIPWLSWGYGMNGYLHYAYNWWLSPSGKSPREDVDQGGKYPPGDGFIVYPPLADKSRSPVSSMRWEAFRDGLEDYEYLVLLRQWRDRQIDSKSLSQSKGPANVPATAKLVDTNKLLAAIEAATGDAQSYPRDPTFISEMRYKIGALLDKLLN